MSYFYSETNEWLNEQNEGKQSFCILEYNQHYAVFEFDEGC